MITDELRDEIRKIIREEISSFYFLDKELKSPLQRYIRRVLVGEIKAIKMYEAGFRPDIGVEYVVSDKEMTSMSFQAENDIDLNAVYKQLVNDKKIDSTFEIFESVLLRKNKYGQKINWIHKIVRSKEINQQSIFSLLYSLDNRIISFESRKRKHLITFICKSFMKNGIDLEKNNIDNSFSKWLKTKKIEQI